MTLWNDDTAAPKAQSYYNFADRARGVPHDIERCGEISSMAYGKLSASP
jgi:hypothetical protein